MITAKNYTGKTVTILTTGGHVVRGDVKSQDDFSLNLEKGAGLPSLGETFSEVEIALENIDIICAK